MFKKAALRCENCGKKLDRSWKFCPDCGEDVEKNEQREQGFFGFDRDFFSFDPFKGFDKQFKSMFSSPRSGGVSISISSGTGMQPRVSVKTSGAYKEMEPEIKKRLGVSEGVEEVKEKREQKKLFGRPRVTEEPDVKIKKEDGNSVYEVKLPGVDEENIEVKRIGSSVEIRAKGKDKFYFKIFEVPDNLSILDKEFKKGILRLEVG